MRKGNVVTIKARGELEFEILWIQARNMEPTGWECALASGADRFIVSLAEIVSHGASITHDVAAAATAFWEAKAADYNHLHRKGEEQKRKRDEAAQKQSKRRLPMLAHAAPTAALVAPQDAEPHLLKKLCSEITTLHGETADLRRAIVSLEQGVHSLGEISDNLKALFHSLLQKTTLSTT
jgi:hypothetical protein